MHTLTATHCDPGVLETSTVEMDCAEGSVDTPTHPVKLEATTARITGITTDAATLGQAQESSLVTLTAEFAHGGPAQPHQALIEWGDGTFTAGAVTEAGGVGSVLAYHIYESGGIYPITLLITDAAGAIATAMTRAVVTGVGLHDDILQIVGTAGDDQVDITLGTNGLVQVRAGFLPGDQGRTVPELEIRKILVRLGPGQNRLTIAGSLRLPIDVGDGSDSEIDG